MKFLIGAMALVLGCCAWFLVRPSPSDAIKSTPRSDSLTKAPDIVVAPASSPMPAAKGQSTRRPSMMGPTGAILTGGKPLEEVQIRYWAEFYDFEITDDELLQAQEAYTGVTAARRKLEDSLAQVERQTPSHFKIVIPAYPELGRELKQQFESDLAAALGADRAREFLSRIEVPLARAHFGWGMADQVLHVVLRPFGEVETLEIAHGFALPDSGALTGVAGVSNSNLSPDNLGIYSYLKRHFPVQPAD